MVKNGHGRAADMAPCLLTALALVMCSPDVAASAAVTIAGNGPELRMIERLTTAFEKTHFGAVVEIRWDPSFQPTHMVKSGEADMAVTGQTDPDLLATPIAWDGIAVVVDFTNPLREFTSLQLAALFSGALARWSDVIICDYNYAFDPSSYLRRFFDDDPGGYVFLQTGRRATDSK